MKVKDGVLVNVRDEDIELLINNPTKFWSGITKIGKEAFRDVNLKEMYDIVIPGTVSIIDDLAFEQCEWIRNVKFGKGVEVIGEKAFSECTNLEKIVLPDNLRVVQRMAFYDCKNATVINIGRGNISIDDTAFSGNYKKLENIHINGNIKGIGNRVLFNCCRHEINITFGANVKDVGAALLGEYNDVREIFIPDNVIAIHEGAFSDLLRLKKVSLQSGLNYIGENAFANCTALYRLSIPGTVTTIDKGAFSCCVELRELVISEGDNKQIYPEAFFSCSSLRKVKIPGCVTYIGDRAFAYCTTLSKVDLENGVRYIEKEAFRGCEALESIVIPESVKRIGSYAFANCEKVESVYIDKNVGMLEEGVFEGCKGLTRVMINEGITSIRKGAFRNCTSLEEIHLPNSLREVGEEAFAGCTNLKRVFFGNQIRLISSSAFKGCPNLKEPIIPEKTKETLSYTFTPSDEVKKEEKKEPTRSEVVADFKKFDENFRNLFGQDKAISTIKNSLLRNVLMHTAEDVEEDNQEKRKGPLATFMFYGPTGTGKTEVSKRMAKFMFNDEKKLLILDMNTYKDPKMVVSQIKGHPEGYIDSSKGTDFTRFLSKNSSGVIVLDEFEKAVPEAREIFMTMLDEGEFKDALGNVYNLSNYVFVATTNISRAFEGKQSSKRIGFSFDEVSYKKENDEKIRTILREEFTAPIINRFNDLVSFEKIERETAVQIAENLIDRLCKNLEGKIFKCEIRPKIIIEDKEKIIDLILNDSDYQKDGARSIKNVIENLILTPILMAIEDKKANIALKINNDKIVVIDNKTRSPI